MCVLLFGDSVIVIILVFLLVFVVKYRYLLLGLFFVRLYFLFWVMLVILKCFVYDIFVLLLRYIIL